MVVQMQSSNLSSLSPSLAVFDATGKTLLGQQSSTNYGSTVSVSKSGLTAGQIYLVRAMGASTGASGYGSYGLQVNFGSSPQARSRRPTPAWRRPQPGGWHSGGRDGNRDRK